MKVPTTIWILAVVGIAGGALFVYCGAFDASADTPHSTFVYWLAQTPRERSIAVRAKGIEIPKLEDPKLIAQGAREYAEMCTGCHLAPGMQDNEMRPGLYPQPPNLSERKHELVDGDLKSAAARQFWIIKHGLKMTGMPAWGKTHDDPTIWSLVAFLQRLPELSPEQYAAMTAKSESAHKVLKHGNMHMSGGEHKHDESQPHEHGTADHDQPR